MLEVIDFEATGLGGTSYPIEVGIALADGRQHSWLIQPAADWVGWSEQAEEIHGITKSRLLSEGLPVAKVCERLNYYCADREFFSDCWVYDSSWLHLLFVTAGIRQTFSLLPIEREFSEQNLMAYSSYKQQATQLLGLTPHRAGNDAKIIQAALHWLQHASSPASIKSLQASCPRTPLPVAPVATAGH